MPEIAQSLAGRNKFLNFGLTEIHGVSGLNRSIRVFRKRRYAILIYISFWPWSMLFETDARASARLLSATWCVGSGRLMANPNFQLLVDAAKLLKPILGELDFVGGCTTALIVRDPPSGNGSQLYYSDSCPIKSLR